MNTSTVAGRRALVGELSRLAELHGCTIKAEADGREVRIVIDHPSGAYVAFDIAPKERDFVLCWVTHRDARFAPRFGEVNPYHHGKATKVSTNPLRDIAHDLTVIDNGQGLMTPAHAAELDRIDHHRYDARCGRIDLDPRHDARRAEIVSHYSTGPDHA